MNIPWFLLMYYLCAFNKKLNDRSFILIYFDDQSFVIWSVQTFDSQKTRFTKKVFRFSKKIWTNPSDQYIFYLSILHVMKKKKRKKYVKYRSIDNNNTLVQYCMIQRREIHFRTKPIICDFCAPLSVIKIRDACSGAIIKSYII